VKLYVMRHGPAEDHADSGIDADRALTAAGRDRVRAVAKGLADGDEAPVTILTSPLVRCVQTAEIVAIATKLGERGGNVTTRRELAPGADTAKLVAELRASPRPRVMLCGHEPDCSQLYAFLLGARMPSPMQKGMVVGFSVRDGDVKLRFVLDPKTLAWERAGTPS
jgi:phosphohistidine phosphatase